MTHSGDDSKGELRGARYSVVTLGCAKNQVDSEGIELLLQGEGAERSETNDADVIIVNTCGFIEAAKQESINTILELAQSKRPGQKLIAAGCLAERYGAELATEIHEIDGIWGARNWASAPAIVARSLGAAWEPRQPGSTLDLLEMAPQGALDLAMPKRQAAGPSAYVKMSDGCNQRCAFCAIPSMKGRLISKPIEAIIREIQELANLGVQECVLIAQDSTNYGQDLGLGRDGLAVLLERITDAVPELPWLRVMYAYPARLTERLFEVMRDRPQICRYLDLPLQHTHQDVLRRMRRPHRPTEELIDWMRGIIPDITIRTTFIVGFPGESDEEFEHLLESVASLSFDRVGAFTYSDEEGTPAFELAGKVSARVKERRKRLLMEAARTASHQRLETIVGTDLDVLVEGRGSLSGRPTLVGRSRRDAPEVDGLVFVDGAAAIGEIVRVRVSRALDYDLVASPVQVAATP
ncbi:MAG: 30S ribosomal protein S12 methylthiotransferase RimO [Chloroflexota bacterium]